MLTGLFADKSPYRKFLLLVSIVLLCTIVFSLAGGLLVDMIYGINLMSDTTALNDLTDPVVINAMKLLQLITAGLGMFLVPSLIAAFVFDKNPSAFLELKKPNAKILAITVATMFVSLPLINILLALNQEMHLPESLSSIENWMKQSEEQAAKLTESFLIMHGAGDFMYNLLVIAVLPALGEEFLFRGVLQKLFYQFTRNIHTAIIITAVLFSAIHMQFYGFLPRMFLGIIFGYMLAWSGSIWLPVLAHFINNAAAVTFSYFSAENQLPFDQDTFGTTGDDIPYVIVSIVLTAVLLYAIKRSSGKLPKDEVKYENVEQ